ncbi:MAG: fibronectin type III domain-containing protein, partial [Betaproteobacteria bacterium]
MADYGPKSAFFGRISTVEVQAQPLLTTPAMRRRSSALGVLALLFALAAGRNVSAATATLTVAWDPIKDPNVKGYIVSYGTTSGVYPTHINVGNQNTYTISGLTNGVTYYLVVQGYYVSTEPGAMSAPVSGIA